MHIAFVCHTYSPCDTPREVLKAHHTTVDWANALVQAGLQVRVIYRFHADAKFEMDGVTYHFLGDRLPAHLRNWHLAYGFHKKVARLVQAEGIEVIHTHNLFAYGPHWTLRRFVRHIPILVQDHSGVTVLKRPWLYRLGLRRMDAFMFAAEGQEQVWVDHCVIPVAKCVFVMENASPFSRQDRTAARAQTGLYGDPVVLWVGNLNPNKAPLMVLTAFDRLLKQKPNARLYMIYRFGEMEAEVRAAIDQRPHLETGVTLLGKMERDQLEMYYNSADYLIAASHKEGAGYAVIEAMSCGVIPVLSAIPSFRALTHEGAVGALFEPGNSDMLFEQLMGCMQTPIAEASAHVQAHYQRHFSFEALAGQAKRLYQRLIDRTMPL